MEKYEYLIVEWKMANSGRVVTIFKPTGEEEKFPIRKGNGEHELLIVLNQLGAQGWQMFDSSKIDYFGATFSRTCFLRRTVIDS